MSFPELWGGVACLDFANTLDGRATERPEENLHTYADVVKWANYAGLLDEEAAARIKDKGQASTEGSDKDEASDKGRDKGQAGDNSRDNGRESDNSRDKGQASDNSREDGEAAATPGDDHRVNGRASVGRQDVGRPADDDHDQDNLRTALELREAIFGIFSAVGRHQPVPKPALDSLQQHFARAMAHAHLDDRRGWYFTGDDPGRAWWPIAVDAVTLLTHGPVDRVKVCAAEAGCVGLFLDTSKNRSRRWCTMDGCGVDAKVKRQAQRRRSARPGTAPE